MEFDEAKFTVSENRYRAARLKIPDKSFYLLNASIINTWETQTRYFGDFTVLRNRTVQKIPILFILLVH